MIRSHARRAFAASQAPRPSRDLLAALLASARRFSDAAKARMFVIDAVAPPSRRCLLHNDAHAGNVMCARDGALVALTGELPAAYIQAPQLPAD